MFKLVFLLWTCAIEPMPILNCPNGEAVCMCNENNCQWVWVNCEEDNDE